MSTVADMAGACAVAAVCGGIETEAIRTTSLHPWFALRIREKVRAMTEQHLASVIDESFSPMTTETRQWSDRRKVVTAPLFSGYLFCRFDPQKQLAVLRSPGVIDLVRSGSRPAEVDANEISALQQTMRVLPAVEVLPHLICGQRVLVVGGPLLGVEGVLLMLKSQWKLVLSVTMMNRSVAVEVDRAQVTAL